MSKVNQLGNYKGITIALKKPEVIQEEVDQAIEQLLARNENFEEKDGSVENGDMTTIDFEGFKDGVAFEGGKGENYRLLIGSNTFIPGFEEQMLGMKKEETRELNLKFPENYGAADLAGAEVVFKVTVHKIEKVIKNELNEEFVKRLGVEAIQTVDDLVNAVKADLEAQKAQTFNSELENKVFGQLVEDSKVSLDEEDINKALSQQLAMMNNQLQQSGMQLEQYIQMMGTTFDDFKETLKPNAIKQAEFEAILKEIINVENIVTKEEEIEKEIQAIAEANKVTVEKVKEQISNEMIEDNFNHLKAMQLIMNAVINTEDK